MKLGQLEVAFHRTVRVAEGRQPSNLPPSLGRMGLYPVKNYDGKCPENWEKSGYFVALHDTEALWMSFASVQHPTAVLVGAGGINALTGEKLGTALEKDNYLVAPPQPWLDGWKDKDGTVYQFVATPYEKGSGNTVAEQLIGEESKTGAIGIAVFDSKEPGKLVPKRGQKEGWTDSAYGGDFEYPVSSCYSGNLNLMKSASKGVYGQSVNSARSASVTQSFSEMGIGKGGKIIQKIYPDPHGLEVWKEKPTMTMAVYLVNAQVFEEITGKKVPAPVDQEVYKGNWFGLQDEAEGDVAGTRKFTGLKSAVFPAAEVQEEQKESEIVW